VDPDGDDEDYRGEHTWSRESVVRVECPFLDEAIEYPEITAGMAAAVVDHHGPCSDLAAWRQLIRSVRALAMATAVIDLNDLAD
jgi:hypothetical protein